MCKKNLPALYMITLINIYLVSKTIVAPAKSTPEKIVDTLFALTVAVYAIWTGRNCRKEK